MKKYMKIVIKIYKFHFQFIKDMKNESVIKEDYKVILLLDIFLTTIFIE